jgi:hypothetical protein
MEQERIPYTRHKTSLGECLVVEDLEVVDTYPELLASGLAIWLPEEWESMPQMPADARKTVWERRLKALASEMAMRAQDGSRTVYGSMDGK